MNYNDMSGQVSISHRFDCCCHSSFCPPNCCYWGACGKIWYRLRVADDGIWCSVSNWLLFQFFYPSSQLSQTIPPPPLGPAFIFADWQTITTGFNPAWHQQRGWTAVFWVIVSNWLLCHLLASLSIKLIITTPLLSRSSSLFYRRQQQQA